MDWRRAFRWILSGFSALLALAFGANVQKLMELRKWDTFLNAGLAAKTGWAATIMRPWFLLLAIAVLAFTAGLWVDSALARLDVRPSKGVNKYARLGHDALHVATVCQAAAESYVQQEATPLLAQVVSILIRLQKAGFDIPQMPPAGPNANPALLTASRYLSVVGTLLSKGQTGEARQIATQMAKSMKPEITDTDGL
jgi:hypothetical protein